MVVRLGPHAVDENSQRAKTAEIVNRLACRVLGNPAPQPMSTRTFLACRRQPYIEEDTKRLLRRHSISSLTNGLARSVARQHRRIGPRCRHAYQCHPRHAQAAPTGTGMSAMKILDEVAAKDLVCPLDCASQEYAAARHATSLRSAWHVKCSAVQARRKQRRSRLVPAMNSSTPVIEGASMQAARRSPPGSTTARLSRQAHGSSAAASLKNQARSW
jgi:hypothetical protein